MKFAPLTAEQEAEEKAKFGPWPDGVYDFEVAEAEDTTSKAGNEMIALDLMVYDAHGNKRKVKDWLLESVPAKLKAACHSVGLHAAYEGGNVAAHDFLGKSGKLKLTTRKQEGFDPRNTVASYIPGAMSVETRRATASAMTRKAAMVGGGAGDLEDEIPF